MPVIRSAIKKVRKDKVRTSRNKMRESVMKRLLKEARKSPTAKNFSAVFSALDKASKVKLIHPNKAARLKSRLSKLSSQPSFVSKSKAARLKSRLSKLSQPTSASKNKSRTSARPAKPASSKKPG